MPPTNQSTSHLTVDTVSSKQLIEKPEWNEERLPVEFVWLDGRAATGWRQPFASRQAAIEIAMRTRSKVTRSWRAEFRPFSAITAAGKSRKVSNEPKFDE